MTLEEYLTNLLTPPPNQGFGVTPDTLARGIVSALRSDGWRVIKLEPFAGTPTVVAVDDTRLGRVVVVTEELS